MVSLQLSIVDRLIEVTTLVRTAEINNNLLTTEKPILLYSAQVFGSGKSTFGVNAISLLKDPAVAQALLNPPPTTDATESPLPFTQELVDAYSNTRTVFVDISYGLAVSAHCIPVEERITFREALFYALYRAAVNDPDTLNHQFIRNLGVDSDSLMRLLIEKTGHKGKWLFFIDEIGVIDRMASDYDDIKNPSKYLNTKPQCIDGFTLLFDILCPFLRRCDTFVFCAGKSASLTEKCLEESGSPVRLRLLAMPNLQSQNIVDVIHKTTHEGQPLQQALGLPDDLLLSFAEIVFRYTGGIPRLVLRAFESILGLATPILQDTDTIEKLMNGKVRDDIVVDTSCFFAPFHLSADATRAYTTLLLMHVLRIKIKKSFVMRIESASTKYALDWISNLCLYISPDGPDTYRLVFSQYVIDYLQSIPPNGNRQISYLAGLLKQLGSFPAFVDQGRILEVMVAQSLACHLAFATTFGEIPGLQQTLLSNVAVPRGVGQGFGIQFLPSFQPNTTVGSSTINGHGVAISYNPTDWHQFFLDLVKGGHMNAVGIAREKNSNGPDLMLPIQVAADSTQLPANFYCLGIAVKNLQAEEEATNWDDVQDEITKGLTVPLQNATLKGNLHVVLVLASTRLMKEIEDVISPRLCNVYDAGTWCYNKSVHKFDKRNPMKDWEEKFTVPERGELVILTKGGMAAILGDGALAALSNCFTHSEDELCQNLLSFGTLVWNHAHKDNITHKSKPTHELMKKEGGLTWNHQSRTVITMLALFRYC